MKSLSVNAVLATVMSLLIAGTSLAKPAEYCVFAPKNDMKIPVGMHMKTGSGLDEKTYNAVIDKVENYYKPIVKQQGAALTINRMWTNDTVNSTAHRTGKKWYVDAYGGLARYGIMTADAEMAVLCHEMGHHLGGFPKVHSIFGSSWASNEGEADYFATMKCFRRLTATDDNTSVLSNMSVPKEVVNGCETSFHSAGEIAVCKRESMAAKILAQVLWELGRGGRAITNTDGSLSMNKDGGGEPAAAPQFGTPSTDVVKATDDEHPLAQCRLDTYFNGALCTADPMVDFGAKDPSTGACAAEKGDTVGVRPICWYKPSTQI